MAADRFTNNGDGTFTDHKLGLMFDAGFWLKQRNRDSIWQ